MENTMLPKTDLAWFFMILGWLNYMMALWLMAGYPSIMTFLVGAFGCFAGTMAIQRSVAADEDQ